MKEWFNKYHLKEAEVYSGKNYNNPIKKYFWHFFLSLSEAVKLLLLSLGSIIHAIFPWVLNFKLLQWRINMLKSLKKKLPNDPNLKKVEFLD